MDTQTIYIRMRPRMKANVGEKLTLADVAQIVAHDPLKEAVADIYIYTITKEDKNIVVIDVMKVIAEIRKQLPEADVQSLGSPQSIIQIQIEKRKLQPIYFMLIWLLLFIGSAIAIMNFHEDVSMAKVHQRLYWIITGNKTERPLLFQIPYSFGLGLGMILFFNHLFKKRLNEEPSPLEVEMFNYEQAIDQYLIIHENKENETKLDGN